jgi:hypothetical protein
MKKHPAAWAAPSSILITCAVASLAFAKPAAHPGHRAPRPQAAAAATQPLPFAPGSAGMIVTIDPETGRLAAPTPAVLAQLLGTRDLTLNHSTEGLVERRMPDGSYMLDLQGRFREYYLVRIDADGGLHPSCLNESDAILKTLLTPPAPAAEDR